MNMHICTDIYIYIQGKIITFRCNVNNVLVPLIRLNGNSDLHSYVDTRLYNLYNYVTKQAKRDQK